MNRGQRTERGRGGQSHKYLQRTLLTVYVEHNLNNIYMFSLTPVVGFSREALSVLVGLLQASEST